jgi:hypothetical protein
MTNEDASQPSGVLSVEQVELLIKLAAIFMPVARKQRDVHYQRQLSGAVADSARFAHYTTAEAALNIIRTKRLWMRNALCMSDYREVQHGFEIFHRFFSNQSKAEAFKAALDKSFPRAAADAIALFDQRWSTTRLHTYIASISEHADTEDLHGRLSMWRAFGGNTARVALVFNVPWNSGGAAALNLLFSPVAYLTEQQALDTLDAVLTNIGAAQNFLGSGSLSRQLVVQFVFNMLLAGVTCLKHEGFGEEREWRAVYSPHNAPSELMKLSTKVIGGVPQVIYEIPLDERVAPALAGLEFSRIFDRLIIGPSPYPLPMCDAFMTALVEAGVPQEVAQQKVIPSRIPIRV